MVFVEKIVKSKRDWRESRVEKINGKRRDLGVIRFAASMTVELGESF